ncbi:RelA/SpoT family protein [Bacteroidota bacterium]
MIWLLKKKDINHYSEKISKEVKADLDYLLSECKKNLKDVDVQLITKAFHFCVEAHKNKVNKPGEPYYKSPLAIAHILISEIPLDQISVICALLYDVPEGSDIYGLKDIHSEFGQTVAEIVEGITKIQHIEEQNIKSSENYRKLLLSLFKDVRIILIKTAEMLYDIRGISNLEVEEQVEIAREALEIYSPFAHRFGLRNLKGELEDLAFQILNPEAYKEIKNKVHLTKKEREEYIRKFTKPIRERLENDDLFRKNDIKFELNGRAKNIYSIYNKIQIRGLPLEKLNDIFAIRIIIDSDDEKYCYLSYSIITDIYELVEDTFKNYIAYPKKNGYQSIHAALQGADGSPVEVQIRTRKMHEISEKGVASHFNYKRGFLPAQSVLDEENTEEWLNLVRSVFEKVGQGKTDELLDSIKKNWHQDEIYVFTPAKEFKIFPQDATPLDFAYAIHSEIGEHCIGAKVNGRIIPLDYKLQSGDQVEILTSKKQKPTKEWLSIVVTQRAKTYVQKYLRDQKIQAEEKGQQLWSDFLSRLNFKVSDKKFKKVIAVLNYNSKADFFIALSTSGFNEQMMFDYIKELLRGMKKKKGNKQDKIDDFRSNGFLDGRENKPGYNSKYKITNTSLAECCNPLPGDKIYGVLSPDGKTIVAHRNNCNKIKNLQKNQLQTLIEMDWSNLKDKDFSVRLLITGIDKPSILYEITSQLSSIGKINILGFNFNTTEEGFKGFLTLSIPDSEILFNVMKGLKAIDGIKSVERYME